MTARSKAASWIARVAVATAILTSVGMLAAPAEALQDAPARIIAP
jgi:hypothetical protein